ncbi:MAG: hypothetical protein LBM96_04340 [Methanobrevibacter sp.]|jgi:hypothetical protein|nr:hypothetical protein [Candidatus Methanoflexus mossambicus]
MNETPNITLEPCIFKIISKIAKNEGKTENEVVNAIIKNSFEIKEDIFEEIEKLSGGKAIVRNKEKYNPNPTKKEYYSICGIAKSPDGISPLETLLEIRNGK